MTDPIRPDERALSRYSLALLGVLLVCGCTSEDGSDQATGGEGGMTNDGSVANDSAAPRGVGAGNGCPVDALDPGEHLLSFEHGGETRDYILFVAGGSGPAPMLLSIHGFVGTAEGYRESNRSDTPSPETAGYTVVYPNGFASDVPVEPVDRAWNAGTCCGSPAMTDRDDVAFFRALVDEVSARTCVDPKRIYSTGMSNGGFMSHRLACEASDIIAAVAPVAGVLGIPAAECNPNRPVPVLHIHGTGDRLVPFEGGQTLGIAPFVSVEETIDTWKSKNGCVGEPVETYQQGTATCSTYEECNAGVELVECRIEGFDHCWPGASTCARGDLTPDLSANERMLSFFERFRLP